MSHLHLNELSLICDMWVNKITYLLTYLLIDNDTRHHSGQNVVDSRGAAE